MGCALHHYRASGYQGLEQKMTANEILREMEMVQGAAKKSDIIAAYRAADEGGTIQAEKALRLFSDPRKHTAMMLRTALKYLGCRDE